MGWASRLLAHVGAVPGKRVFGTFRTKAAGHLTKRLAVTWAPEMARRKDL